MDIDLKTVAEILTHAITFVIFLVILKKYAWGPVDAIGEKRRNKIQGEFDKIERLKAEVSGLKEDYEKKIAEIEGTARQARLDEINRGKEIAEKMLADAKTSIDLEHEQLSQQLAMEISKAKVDLRDFIIDLAIQSSSKLIHQSMDDPAHRRLVDEYIRQVSEIQN